MYIYINMYSPRLRVNVYIYAHIAHICLYRLDSSTWIPAAAAYISLKIARLFLDAAALANVLSINLCETVSNAAEKSMSD